MLIEIRWHGRGGQGVWTASNLLAMAATSAGKHTQSFPAFGPERSGAPVLAFTRISDEPIEIHSMVYNPDIVVVLDPTLLATIDVKAGLKEKGLLVINYEGDKEKLYRSLGIEPGKYEVWVTPASRIALEILKRNITNTAMIGALVKATNIVDLDTVFKVVKERFPEPLAEKNIELIKKAYKETQKV